MTEEHAKRLGDRLLEADLGRETGSTPAGGMDPMFEHLLQTEEAFEKRVRWLAFLAWGSTFVCTLLFFLALFVIRVSGGALIEVTRAGLLAVGAIGILSLFVGVVALLSWLFRSRAATLRAIERRLAALERTDLHR